MNDEEAKIVDLLVAAQKSGGNSQLDPAVFAHLDRDAAYRIIEATQRALAEEPAMYKTNLHPDGLGVAAPIWKSRVGYSPDFVFPPGFKIKGLEFEIGVKLASDIPAGADEAAVSAAVEHYFLGIEIVGTRVAALPGAPKQNLAQGLADNMSALGYVIGRTYDHEPDVEGLPVSLQVDGKLIDQQPAKYPFGTLLASITAYAQSQKPHLPLRAGILITPGSVNGCVLLPEGATGRVIGKLGNETPVEFVLQ